jgi:hypothetical protein
LIDGRSVFEEELNLISLPEGEHFLTLTIVDSLKNSTTEIMPIIIDRTKPSLSILSPSNTDPVEGIITVSGEIGDFTNGLTYQILMMVNITSQLKQKIPVGL